MNGKDARVFSYLPFKEFLAVVSAEFDEALKPHCFEKISDRRWIRSVKQPIREIVEFSKINNLYFNPKWGFSFDYVPHVDAIEIKWHQTNRKAMFDLTFDPVDVDDIRVWAVYNSTNLELLKIAGKESAKRVVATAMPLFDRVKSIADLPAIFEERLRQNNSRFGFFNYVQHPLAYAFTFARLKNEFAAKDWLQKAVQYKQDPAVKQKLLEILNDTLSGSVKNRNIICLSP